MYSLARLSSMRSGVFVCVCARQVDAVGVADVLCVQKRGDQMYECMLYLVSVSAVLCSLSVFYAAREFLFVS